MSGVPPSPQLELSTMTTASILRCYVITESLILAVKVDTDAERVRSNMLYRGILRMSFLPEDIRLHLQAVWNIQFHNLPIIYDGQSACFLLDENSLGHPHPPICLDFLSDACLIRLLPQTLWRPSLDVNVSQDLEGPVFFDHSRDYFGEGRDLKFGVTVHDAIRSGNNHDFEFLQARPQIEFRSTTKIRLCVRTRR